MVNLGPQLLLSPFHLSLLDGRLLTIPLLVDPLRRLLDAFRAVRLA